MKKAQMALEFVIMLGFIMFVFMFIFSVIVHNVSEAQSDSQRKDLVDIINRIDGEITSALYVRDGYSRIFLLPEYSGNTNYTIHINPLDLISAPPARSTNSEVIVRLHEDYGEPFELVKYYYMVDVNIGKGCNLIEKKSGQSLTFTPLGHYNC